MQTRSILLAAMSLDLGGAETHVVTLARELAARGHRVHVASAPGRLVGALREAGIGHYEVPLHSRAPQRLLQAIGMLAELLALLQVDVIHAHARIPAFVAQWARAGRPLPLVTTYHGLYNASWFYRMFSRWGERVIAVSPEVERHLVTRLGVPPDIIRVIPNGIDAGAFHPGVEPAAPLRADTGPHIVHAGRQAGPNAAAAAALIAAMPAVAAAVPGAVLWIVGDGAELPRLREAAARCNAAVGRGAVQVVGGQTEMPPWLAGADVVAGVGRVAVEAMACGRPVIVAGIGGYRGIVDEEQLTGLHVTNFTARGSGRPLDPAVIGADLTRLLGDGAWRQRLGQAGRQFVLDHMTIEKMTDAVWGVYEEALAGGRRQRHESH